jgi:two-component system, OmpR family, response regulator
MRLSSGRRTPRLMHREHMMQRNNQSLTRADVYMRRLRLKVDMPNEIPRIHNVRGAGFILRAAS